MDDDPTAAPVPVERTEDFDFYPDFFDQEPFVPAPVDDIDPPGPPAVPRTPDENARLAAELLRKYCRKRPEGDAVEPFVVGPG